VSLKKVSIIGTLMLIDVKSGNITIPEHSFKRLPDKKDSPLLNAETVLTKWN
jgi:hypothetical protein